MTSYVAIVVQCALSRIAGNDVICCNYRTMRPQVYSERVMTSYVATVQDDNSTGFDIHVPRTRVNGLLSRDYRSISVCKEARPTRSIVHLPALPSRLPCNLHKCCLRYRV